jgi:hypothetical protein
MLRSTVGWLAAPLLAAAIGLAPAPAAAGWRWSYYDGGFVVSDTHSFGHEYIAFNPSCAWLRRLVPTPVGLRWQLVPVCF